jgi:hypothetical protein
MAEVLKFDISGYKRDLHKYEEVCKEMGIKHLLLVEPIDPLHLDCMGNRISVKKFCLKKLGGEKKERFLRGYINKKLGEVVCEMGDEALVSIGCDKRDKHFCKEPAKGCAKLKKVYAHAHEVDYHSFIKKDVDNVLNCYFSLPIHMKAAKVKEVLDPLPFEEEPIIDKDIFGFDHNPKRYLQNIKSP